MKGKDEGFYEDILMSGFGGQGLMFIGKLLAYSAMKEGKHVTWIPSYGPEMRGGTANCTVVISSEPIGSPVTSHPKSAIIMNNPSMEAFEPKLQSNGLLLFSSSFVNKELSRDDIRALAVPASELAISAGSEKAANMVMLGSYVELKNVVSKVTVRLGLKELFGAKLDAYESNIRAFDQGMRFAGQNAPKLIHCNTS